MATCAREFRPCDQQAMGYGRFPLLCFRCARVRILALGLKRRRRAAGFRGAR